MIKYIKNICYYLNGKKINGISKEKELQKTNKKQFRIEKVIKETGGKLYVKEIIICLIVG